MNFINEKPLIESGQINSVYLSRIIEVGFIDAVYISHLIELI